MNYWGTKIDGSNDWRTKIVLLLTVYQTGFFLLEMPGGKNEKEKKEFYIGLRAEIIHLT